jgi:hypothetical protein
VLPFSIANTSALRDVAAMACFTGASTGLHACLSGRLGVGHTGLLTKGASDVQLLNVAQVSIDTPDPDRPGEMNFVWRWRSLEGLEDGDAYALTLKDSAGNVLLMASRPVDYDFSNREGCEPSLSAKVPLQ